MAGNGYYFITAETTGSNCKEGINALKLVTKHLSDIPSKRAGNIPNISRQLGMAGRSLPMINHSEGINLQNIDVNK
eukprot:6663200-Ditylum_brightwellii.AAC.1